MRRAVLLVALVSGCGGASQAVRPAPPSSTAPVVRGEPIDDPIPEPTRKPLEVAATTAREGTLLRVDVAAVGRGHAAGEDFERPGSWNIEARVQGDPLKLLLRGPVRVERGPAGAHAWDVEVAFSVYFQLPGVPGRPLSASLSEAPVALAVTPPGEPGVRRFQLSLPATIASR
ncbi:MAG: hypothetical protein IT370_29375 [Deltaproteobacteria bacterium]|nr:hypothetical protein [Deltaproteobacteria bacterium]